MSTSALKPRILRLDAAGMGLAAALTAAAYLVGVEPLMNVEARIQEQDRLMEQQLRLAADTEQLLVNEQAKLAELKRRLSASNVQLSPVSEINRRLDRIARLLEAHGLVMQMLDPGAPHSDPELGKFLMVPIRLSGLGSFPGVAAFLHELLSREFPDVELRSLNLTAPVAGGQDAAAGPDKGAFAIELRWYAAPAVPADASTSR